MKGGPGFAVHFHDEGEIGHDCNLGYLTVPGREGVGERFSFHR